MAYLLGYQPSGLSYLLYKLPADRKYTHFSIPKKGGGERQIDAPVPRIRQLQSKLADLLYDCNDEIEQLSGRKNKLSHAYLRSRSILTNARAHRNRRYVLNLDLEGFFPALNFGRIRGFFLTNRTFKLSHRAATIVAQIACHENALPQGSPCSPIISELVTHFLDIRLATLAKNHRCTYTRYADDITFSTNQATFPNEIAFQTPDGWQLGPALLRKIERADFKINHAKTRMQFRASRQTVTGLVVNEKVNVQTSYYKRARAMAHCLFNTGSYMLAGWPETSLTRLEGIINHIHHVREGVIDAAIESEDDSDRKKLLRTARSETKRKAPSSIRVLYHRFLFYKYFIVPSKPLILTEGTTDSVYLKAAIEMLPPFHDTLLDLTGGKRSFRVNFFNYGKQARDLLQLGGGTGDFKFFLTTYKRLAPSYGHNPGNHPVIVLIDNDAGSKSVFSLMSNLFHVSASLMTDLPFYKMAPNLYLIKTPTIDADGSSYIEQFFDEETLGKKVNGDRFNPNKEHEAAGEYGKVLFAEKVIRPNRKTTDFTNFSKILERIVAAVADHAASKIAAAQS